MPSLMPAPKELFEYDYEDENENENEDAEADTSAWVLAEVAQCVQVCTCVFKAQSCSSILAQCSSLRYCISRIDGA